METRALPTPVYVIDEDALRRNLDILHSLEERTGCRVLLAQKAFSAYYFYPLIGSYISGTAASGLYEARLGREEMGKENHVFSPAYTDAEFGELAEICDHIVFNSFSQLEKFYGRRGGASVGMRVNPECSTQDHAIYDPCAPGSRMGVRSSDFRGDMADMLDGLHMHTLCEQNADALDVTVKALEEKFGAYLPRMKWLNLGGGHHITRPDYDINLLERIILRLRDRYGVTVYLEPGEAVALNAGELVTAVMTFVDNGITTAVLDASAACHMPDVLEMPYRPNVLFLAEDGLPSRAGLPGKQAWTCRLAGKSCLAGDVAGEYSFSAPLLPGQRLAFEDMAIYSMVKTTTFNGLRLPSIGICEADAAGGQGFRLLRQFGYEDFKGRLS